MDRSDFITEFRYHRKRWLRAYRSEGLEFGSAHFAQACRGWCGERGLALSTPREWVQTAEILADMVDDLYL